MPSKPAAPQRRSPKRSEPDRSSLFVGSVEKAFQVLEAFDGTHRRMSLAEISRAADLDRSATQRLVHTMEALGYIRRLPDSTLYGLGSKLLRFSYNYLRGSALVERASPYLLDISRTLGETCNLQELDGHEIVFLARFPGKHLVNLDFQVGFRMPAAYTASGLAILSRLPAAQAEAIVRATPPVKVTPFTETDPAKLLAQVALTAERGYAMVMNQTAAGDISVAAPITDSHGQPIGAINIAVATTRWTLETAEATLVPHVQVAATAISGAHHPAWK